MGSASRSCYHPMGLMKELRPTRKCCTCVVRSGLAELFGWIVRRLGDDAVEAGAEIGGVGIEEMNGAVGYGVGAERGPIDQVGGTMDAEAVAVGSGLAEVK